MTDTDNAPDLSIYDKAIQDFETCIVPDRALDGEIDVRFNNAEGEQWPAHYSGSLDAKLPGEYITSISVSVSRDTKEAGHGHSLAKGSDSLMWRAVHQDPFGTVFVGEAHNEACARRAARLKSMRVEAFEDGIIGGNDEQQPLL
tara:strand:- start:55633 stop:56064 length:432 start_codon:yes stop_codon:yes gene_type:complete